MATTPPTTQELSDNIVAQMSAQLNQTIPLLPRSFIRVMAKAVAAVVVILYKYIGFVAMQQLIRYASIEETTFNGVTFSPLITWGEQVGAGRPGEATRAEITATVPVEQAGGTIAAGELLYSTTNGYTYSVLTSVVLGGSSVTITVRAVSDQTDTNGTGAAGNLTAGAALQFARPQTGAGGTATVVSQTVTAADAEDTEVYRQRVLDRFQKRPQGGAYSDYEIWAEEAEGIINAYPYTGDPGQINVYSEATVASSGNEDGIPTTAQLAAVLEAINQDSNDLASRRSANAFVNSLPITRQGFTVTVTGITGVDDLAQVRADTTDAVEQYFLGVEPYIAGLSIPPRNDQLTNTRLSAIVEDIVTAAGGTFTGAVFTRDGHAGAVASWVLLEGQKAKASAVNFL